MSYLADLGGSGRVAHKELLLREEPTGTIATSIVFGFSVERSASAAIVLAASASRSLVRGRTAAIDAALSIPSPTWARVTTRTASTSIVVSVDAVGEIVWRVGPPPYTFRVVPVVDVRTMTVEGVILDYAVSARTQRTWSIGLDARDVLLGDGEILTVKVTP